jgi:hypothetical protein
MTRLLTAAFFSLKNELRRTLVARDLIKDRQQLAGDGGVVEIVERIDPPVIRGTPGIGESSRVQARDALVCQDARKHRPAVSGLRLAIDRAG